MLTLRPARPEEAEALTALCHRSKAVWGYDAAFMRLCRAELTVTVESIRSGCVQVAEREGRVVGTVQVSSHGGVAVLDRMFVEPDAVRSGAGRALFEWARGTARSGGATVLSIDADPNAADFYRRMGAVDDGFVPSGSIPGRVLPRLRVDLSG